MTSIETRRYEMLVRVRDFGNTHGQRLPESSRAREQFAAVDAAVKKLSEYAVTKMSAKEEGKRKKAAARAALFNRLTAMGLTARAIGRDIPGFDDRFRIPRPRSDQALLTAGRLFARDAELSKEQFLAHAMPETFVAELVAVIDAFEHAIQDREVGKAERTAARASIVAALDTGTAAVQKLVAMVKNHLRGDPTTTALWESASRVGQPRRPRHGAVIPPPVQPTPTAVQPAPPVETTASSVMEKAS